uniref:hypothetical protein n=1 Tax=Thaumasiovibrio occultus TaxID=1891184 RepID=UPI000B35B328|nr:hypothetical protein [Thaumasiovibrio occultus]
MKKSCMAVCALLYVSLSPAMANDTVITDTLTDCVVGAPAPLIENSDTPNIKSYDMTFNTSEGFYDLVETITLASGRQFSISQGGCAHFTEVVKFPLAQPFDGNLIAEAKTLLNESNEVAQTMVAYYLNEVSNDHPTPEHIEIQPGYTTIYITQETIDGQVILSTAYDVAI